MAINEAERLLDTEKVDVSSLVGGMYSILGPTIDSVLTILLRESLRTYFGVKLVGMAETIYGLLLILALIFMPRGIYGFIESWLRKPSAPPTHSGPAQPQAAQGG